MLMLALVAEGMTEEPGFVGSFAAEVDLVLAAYSGMIDLMGFVAALKGNDDRVGMVDIYTIVHAFYVLFHVLFFVKAKQTLFRFVLYDITQGDI